MNNQSRKMGTSSLLRTRRFQVIGIVAAVVIFAIAATAISLQTSKAENAKGEQAEANSSRANAVPLRSGQDGQTFTQSQIRPLTQQEAQQLAEGIKKLVNQSTEGLKQVRHADGSVSMDLEGRFQNIALAKKTDDGHVTQSCVDNLESAAAFLGINRELIDGPKNSSPKRREPVKSNESGMAAEGQNQ